MDVAKIKMIHNNILFFFEGGNLDDTIKLKSGLELYKDTSFEPTFSIKDKAVAVACGAKSKVPEMSVVWVSYLLTHSDNKKPLTKDETGSFYQGKDDDVFMWESDETIQTVNQWVIIQPEEVEKEIVSEAGIIFLNHKEKGNEKRGTIRFMNEEINKKLGLKIGDNVLLAENAHYEFDFKGEKLYRVDSNISILGVDNG